MKRLGIPFSNDEYEAILRRIAYNKDKVIDYDEFVNAILPLEPYYFPAFRSEFDKVKIFNNLQDKMEEFSIKVT